MRRCAGRTARSARTAAALDRITKLKGKSTRPGVYKCNDCRKPFTVTVGTVFERSHVPLHKWVQAVHLMAASKKGIRAHQLHRMLGVTYKTAWFMAHRIREAMRSDDLTPFGSAAAWSRSTRRSSAKTRSGAATSKGRGYMHKSKVLALVDRGTGRARAMVVDHLSKKDVYPILKANIAREARVMTDEAPMYRGLGDEFADHETVNHGDGRVRRAATAHTNTIEGYFSIFKRGMKGVYQHCGEQHLHRYLAEFDFRYNNRAANGVDDADRAALILKGIEGRRLTYR